MNWENHTRELLYIFANEKTTLRMKELMVTIRSDDFIVYFLYNITNIAFIKYKVKF